MANLCSFTAKVTTLTLEAMKKAFKVILDYRYCSDLYLLENGHCGVTEDSFDNFDYESLKTEDGMYQGTFESCCRWAVNGPFADALLRVVRETGAIIEVFADEEGIGFQEHLIFEGGNITCNDCKDWSRYCIYDYSSEYEDEFDEEINGINKKTVAWFNKQCDTDFTVVDFDSDGYVEVGGVENYLDFAPISREDLERSYHDSLRNVYRKAP